MNFLLTLLFLFLFYLQCRLAGTVICDLTGYNATSRLQLIFGYFTTFLILFFPGFIAQLLHCSSTIYGILNFALLIAVDVFFYLYIRKHHLSWEKLEWKKLFKNYWFLIVYVGIFTYFCMASQLGYAQGGYDDSYYIAKIVNNSGVPQIGMEDYYYGNPVGDLSISVERIFNTYELSYGWLSGLFHINTAYFCRVTMTIVNNTLFCLAMMEFAGLFLHKEELLQYVVAPIIVFLVPTDVLLHTTIIRGLGIRSFDSWQMTTAMFYGGSVVRMTMLPIVIIAAQPLLKRISLRPLLVCAGLCLSYLSFSTIAVLDGIVLIIALLLVKLGLRLVDAVKHKQWSRTAVYSGIILLIVILLYEGNKLSVTYMSNPDTAESARQALVMMTAHRDGWYVNDIAARFGFIPSIACIVLSTKRTGKVAGILILLLWYMICSFSLIGLLLVFSFFYFFVYLRLVSSMQILAFGMGAIALLIIIERYMYKYKKLAPITAATFAALILGLFAFNSESWKQYDGIGSGVSTYGWNWMRPFDLTTNMIPDVVTDLGEYYNSLPYDNYITATPYTVRSNGVDVEFRVLLGGSNRLEVLSGELENVFFDYLQNHNGTYQDMMQLVEDNDISYLLSVNADTTAELEGNGWEPVKNSPDYVLLKKPQ